MDASPTPPDREHPATVSRFRVVGMDCAAEEQLVRMAVADLDGVVGITIDLGAREVVIEHTHDTAEVDAALQALDLGTTHLEDRSGGAAAATSTGERPALVLALVINAGFFVGELTVGLLSGSMGLVADALDMGADASVYALSLLAVGTATVRKKQLARASGYVQLGLAAVGLVEVVRRVVATGTVPDPTPMIVVSLLALLGNVVVLVALHRVRTGEVHLEASWIFTANDVKVNLLVIVAALLVSATGSALPDLLAGAVIFVVVANGARRILRISR
ncbi:MAG: cation transporter [Nitriliruptoraceae bacterium]